MNKLTQAFKTLQTQHYQYKPLNETTFIGYFTNGLVREIFSEELTQQVLETVSTMHFSKRSSIAITNIIIELEENYSGDYSKSFTDQLIKHHFSAQYDRDANNYDELTNLGKVIADMNDEFYQLKNTEIVNYLTLLSGILYIEAQHALMFNFLETKACEME